MLEGNDLRGSEYNRGTGCEKTARPGLHGGRRATGVPTVEPKINQNNHRTKGCIVFLSAIIWIHKIS